MEGTSTGSSLEQNPEQNPELERDLDPNWMQADAVDEVSDEESQKGDSDMDDTPDVAQSVDSRLEALKKVIAADYPHLVDRLLITKYEVGLQDQGCPTIHPRSWKLVYPALSFMMNGQLFAEYSRVMGMLG
jgi:hypothetical protein